MEDEELELIHRCGVKLVAGEYDTYETYTEPVKWVGSIHRFEGTCPACGKELDPEEDTITVSGQRR